MSPLLERPSPGEFYDDGMSLYLYLRGNPGSYTDPAGAAANHLYPLYLGGNPNGPGMNLSREAHSAFHASIHAQLRHGFGEAARYRWESLSDVERKLVLARAAADAGVDISQPKFLAALDECIMGSTPGIKATRAGQPKLFKITEVPKGTAKRVVEDIPALNKLRTVGLALAVVGGVMQGVSLAESLSLTNPALQELVRSTRRARAHGSLNLWDEAFGLMDFYELTQDPISAGYAWTQWSEGL